MGVRFLFNDDNVLKLMGRWLLFKWVNCMLYKLYLKELLTTRVHPGYGVQNREGEMRQRLVKRPPQGWSRTRQWLN